eukprot:jgi/Pico_ML_1/54302/g4670.t1
MDQIVISTACLTSGDSSAASLRTRIDTMGPVPSSASQQLDLQALYGGEENCVATFTIAIASFHVVHVASPFETIHPMGSNPKRLPSL